MKGVRVQLHILFSYNPGPCGSRRSFSHMQKANRENPSEGNYKSQDLIQGQWDQCDKEQKEREEEREVE
jgi:hypothetical protein